MCLLTAKGRYFKARYDITCYKIVYLENSEKWSGAYGYGNKTFDFDKVLVESKGCPKPKHDWHGRVIHESPFVELHEGYFHSCVYKKECEGLKGCAALLRAEFSKPNNINNFVVCECTIPKGTIYYTSENDHCFASRKIIVHKPENL